MTFSFTACAFSADASKKNPQTTLNKKAVNAKVSWDKLPTPGAPVTITDTVYGVLRTHRALRGMQENRQVLQHEVNRAKAGFGPRLDIQGSTGGSYLSDGSTRASGLDNQMYGIGEISARLTQPIWDGFATRARVRTAKATLESVNYRVFDTATSLALDGIIAHINLIRRREIYKLSSENVENHRSILAQTEDRSNLGADVESDVTQAQARLARALSTLSEAKAALIIAEDTYTRLTGMAPPAKLEPAPMPYRLFDGPSATFEVAEKNNPKLAAYMQDIRVEKGNKELAESAYYPTFNIETGPSYSNRGGYDDRWISSYDALVTMRWNLFSSGADVEAVNASSARIRQSRQTLQDYRDSLKLDIESTWANYTAAKEQFKYYTDAMEYNEFTCAAYMEQFQMGKRSLLDVLDAENELYSNSVQAITANGNIFIGAYRLNALSGDMLHAMSIDLEPLYKTPKRDPANSRENFAPGWFE